MGDEMVDPEVYVDEGEVTRQTGTVATTRGIGDAALVQTWRGCPTCRFQDLYKARGYTGCPIDELTFFGVEQNELTRLSDDGVDATTERYARRFGVSRGDIIPGISFGARNADAPDKDGVVRRISLADNKFYGELLPVSVTAVRKAGILRKWNIFRRKKTSVTADSVEEKETLRNEVKAVCEKEDRAAAAALAAISDLR